MFGGVAAFLALGFSKPSGTELPEEIIAIDKLEQGRWIPYTWENLRAGDEIRLRDNPKHTFTCQSDWSEADGGYVMVGKIERA